jgi:amino acid adenylation domain-containing protein
MIAMTPAQRGIWHTERAGVAGTAYRLGLSIRFDGPLDVAALRAACDAVLARHDALRQVVTEIDGVPYLAPGGGDAWGGAPGGPFDLTRGPLARFALRTAAPGRHELIFEAHHLVFDGESKDILVRELAAAYNGAALPPVPDPPGPPAAGDPAAAREFWRARWREPAGPLLPGVRGAPGAGAGAAVPVPLDGCALDAARDDGAGLDGAGLDGCALDGAGLDGAAGRLGVSRFELLLAGVHAMLRRYGDPAPVVAVAVSTRDAGSAGRIGLFVNELPTYGERGYTFADLAAALRADLRAAYRFRAVPVAPAVGLVVPRTALTPISVSYRRRGPDVAFHGVRATVDWTVFPGTARGVLHLQAVDGPSGLTGVLQYCPAGFDPGAVPRIAAHLRTLLAAAVAAPGTPVDDLPLLPPEERDLVLHGFNARRGSATAPGGATVVDLFLACARRAPDAVAVTCAGRSLTYAQLDAASAGFADALRSRGVRPGDLVAVGVARSIDMLVTVLGVMRAGAAYLPVDPAYPQRRREQILADAGPALVVDGAGIHPVAGGGAGSGPADLAYVMYTSGSTGRPKGVAVPHGALTNLLRAIAAEVGAAPEHAWLALTSLSFDISGLELYLPLVTGGRVVIAPDGMTRDGAVLARLVRDSGVTHVQATPSGWRMLLAGGFDTPVVALAGGEALPPALAAELRGRVRRLINVYGPTETTIWSTLDDVTDPSADVTIGRPIDNTTVYVLDARERPVPLGLPGELWIGGAGVARGYLGRPELTAQRFRPDRFGPPGPVYRTGDLVRYRPDGRLEFLGRIDDQVKIRGHRVEPGEIEARLLEHPAVEQAAVVAHPGPDGDPALVGYVVLVGSTWLVGSTALVGSTVPPAAAGVDLRAHLAASLPAAMIPGTWVTLDRLPLTPNGKLDRAALSSPHTVPARARAGGASAISEALRDIWAEVLGIGDIGDDEDLFDLGGHSLTITQIMARIEKRLGVAVPMEVFYDTPTITDVAAAIGRARGVDGS